MLERPLVRTLPSRSCGNNQTVTCESFALSG